jgi:peptide/nickel transport system permease protein
MGAAWVPSVDSRRVRVGAAIVALLVGWGLSGVSGGATLVNFERYLEDEQSGAIREVTWTLIPWSPQYSRSDMVAIAPGERIGDVERLEQFKGTPFGERRVILGTDALGGDVLSQMLWACRLSISIGLVSTGISVLIGVTMGAIMGYFGGKVDMVLFRIVEIFMAVPVLFLLIVAAGVLPRDTYVMMAIIGCFSWTGAARFTRAEFMKLRNQDFVQAAKATGLPLRAILFRHMLPNGVTPVLVDASFAIAAAISIEATLSYLGLGPDGQASWGKLLSSATAATGTFVWWLAVFPGLAIFLSVLSYNLLGEAMRDAIDPKLRKAAH